MILHTLHDLLSHFVNLLILYNCNETSQKTMKTVKEDDFAHKYYLYI